MYWCTDINGKCSDGLQTGHTIDHHIISNFQSSPSRSCEIVFEIEPRPHPLTFEGKKLSLDSRNIQDKQISHPVVEWSRRLLSYHFGPTCIPVVGCTTRHKAVWGPRSLYRVMLKGVNLINTWLCKSNDKAEYGRDLDHIVLGLREPYGVNNANNGHIGPFFAIASGKRVGRYWQRYNV